jgi:hypothetical protein
MLINSLSNIVMAFWEPIIRTDNITVSLPFKSIKCFVYDGMLVLKFCFIKAHSRTMTSINLVGIVLKEARGPIEVNVTIRWSHTWLIIYFLSFRYLLERRFGTIYRQVKQKTVNYCETVKHGKFVSTNLAYIIFYNAIKDSWCLVNSKRCI